MIPKWDQAGRSARGPRRARNAYLVRGTELGAIQNDKSWKQRYNYATFEEYCEERWELTDRHARYLIDAAAFANRNFSSGQMPARETHIRPLLGRLESDTDRIAVWRDVLAATNGPRSSPDYEPNAASNHSAATPQQVQ
jgi:hypothetical protein